MRMLAWDVSMDRDVEYDQRKLKYISEEQQRSCTALWEERANPICSAQTHTRAHTHTLTKNTSTLSLSHSCREFVLFKISRDLLVLFVICACKRLHMLECFRDLKWKMMQLMWQVSSTPEIKSLASCKLPARYRLSCPKSRLQVIIRRKSVCK